MTKYEYNHIVVGEKEVSFDPSEETDTDFMGTKRKRIDDAAKVEANEKKEIYSQYPKSIGNIVWNNRSLQ